MIVNMHKIIIYKKIGIIEMKIYCAIQATKDL